MELYSGWWSEHDIRGSEYDVQIVFAQFECVEQIAAHQEASVSALGVPPWSTSGRVLNGCFFSGGSDGSVRFWRSTNGKVEKVQALDLKGKLPLDLAVAYLPGSNG